MCRAHSRWRLGGRVDWQLDLLYFSISPFSSHRCLIGDDQIGCCPAVGNIQIRYRTPELLASVDGDRTDIWPAYTVGLS